MRSRSTIPILLTALLIIAASSQAVAASGAEPPSIQGQVSLPLLVHILVLLELAAFFTLFIMAVIRAFQRKRGEAFLLLALVGFAMVIRLFASPLLPIGANNGDMTHLHDIAIWSRDGLYYSNGIAYPPAFRLLLYGLFQIFGPSANLAIVATKFMGALTVVPCYLTAYHLTRSPIAGLFAALALAAYPSAIYFSNGINLAVPAGFFLLCSLAFLGRLLTHGRMQDSALYILSLVLYTQCRAEGAGILPLLFLTHLLMIAEARGFRRFLSHWPMLLQGAALLVPYFILAFKSLAYETGGRDILMLFPCLIVGAGIGLLAFLLSRALERQRALMLTWTILLLGATAYVSIRMFADFAGNPFWPSPFISPETPYATLYIQPVPGQQMMGARFLYREFGIFPALFLPLLMLSLLPGRLPGSAPGRFRLSLTPFLILLLPIFGFELMNIKKTGIIIAEGFRFHISFAGLTALSAGLGAWRIVEWLRHRPWAKRALPILAAAVLLSPLLTIGFYRDSEHNPQNAFPFTQDAIAALPDGALLLMPDHQIDLRPCGGDINRVSRLYRTGHLLEGLSYTRGKRIKVMGLQQYLSKHQKRRSNIFFYFGLTCYRHPGPDGVHPSCREVEKMAGGAPLLKSVKPNRVYMETCRNRIGPKRAHLTFKLIRLAPGKIPELRKVLQRAGK